MINMTISIGISVFEKTKKLPATFQELDARLLVNNVQLMAVYLMYKLELLDNSGLPRRYLEQKRRFL